MVKKKSFWLTLLAVLTAVVLAFCACGLVGCSSESDEDDNDDDTKTEGTEGGGTEGGGTSGGTSGGTEGGGTSGGTEGGGSGSGSGSGSSDAIVFQGYTVSDGVTAWTVVTLDETTMTGTMASYDDQGNADEEDYGELTWEYSDDDKTAISGTMKMVNSSMWSTMSIPISFALTYVDGKVVAAKYHINYVNMDLDLFEGSVTAALESDGNVGSGHAQLILYDESCTVVMDGTTSYGTWDWTSDKTGISVSVGGSTYNTTSIESYTSYDGVSQITEATFLSFGSASDVTFLHILDEELAVNTLYEFESTEGYTLVIYKDYKFDATVGSTTVHGTTNSTLTSFDDEDFEKNYIATTGTDDDGNITLTFANGFFGDVTESVTFVVKGSIKGKEDGANYQTYYNNAEHGTAIAVLTGAAYYTSSNEEYTDGGEYWLFLYKDGAFVAHVNETSSSVSNGAWSWSEETVGSGLVPTFTRNPGSTSTTSPEVISYATQGSDGTWSVAIKGAMSDIGYEYPSLGAGIYWVYTFTTEEMPAGAFVGNTSADGTGSTVYLVLNGDGTFTAHIDSTIGESTGVWSKDESGNMTFYKTSASGAISALCTITDEDEDGVLTVGITIVMDLATYYYAVDSSVVPVGGHVYTDDDKTAIEKLEKEAQGSEGGGSEEIPDDATYVSATLTTDSFKMLYGGYELTASEVTVTLSEDGNATLVCDLMQSGYGCTYYISGSTFSITIAGLGTTSTGTITYAADGVTIASVSFTEFAGVTQNVVFTASTT